MIYYMSHFKKICRNCELKLKHTIKSDLHKHLFESIKTNKANTLHQL